VHDLAFVERGEHAVTQQGVCSFCQVSVELNPDGRLLSHWVGRDCPGGGKRPSKTLEASSVPNLPSEAEIAAADGMVGKTAVVTGCWLGGAAAAIGGVVVIGGLAIALIWAIIYAFVKVASG
jgi:hypothetical protein